MRKKYASKLKLWSQTGGRKSGEYNLKNINYPELNEDLAEFIGAHLGDGTMSKYFIKISGDYRYDLSYFNFHFHAKLPARFFEWPVYKYRSNKYTLEMATVMNIITSPAFIKSIKLIL